MTKLNNKTITDGVKRNVKLTCNEWFYDGMDGMFWHTMTS